VINSSSNKQKRRIRTPDVNRERVAQVIIALLIGGWVATGCRSETQPKEPADPHAGHNHAAGEHAGQDHGDADHDDIEHAGEDGARLSASEWCYEHDLPEAVCTKCNPELIAKFKAEGDWCGGHGIPESNCRLCNPEFVAKFDALRPMSDTTPATGVDSPFSVERVASTLRPANKSDCNVEETVVRLLDPSLAAKSGITVAPVTKRRISAVVQAPAEIRYDQTRSARITPRAPGVSVEVPIDLGATVARGDVLAVLESPTIGAAKAAYIEAFQRHGIAQTDLDRHNRIHDGIEQMLAACAHDAPSSKVREQYAEVRIGEYKSRLLNAHGQLEFAQKRFDREKDLVDRGISSQDVFQVVERDLEKAQAEFAATHEAIEIEMDKEHQAFSRALTVADVGRDAARRRLLILGVDAAGIAQLDAGEDENLARYAVRSPITGRVVERSAVVGENVTADDVLFAVADTTRMWLLLNLEERDLASVRGGQRVRFTLDGLPGRDFSGAIDWISSAVEEPSRTVRARVPLNNPDGLLRANMFGNARVIVHDESEVIAVPPAAIQTDGCCNIVFIQESPEVFRPRKVVIGSTTPTAIEITAGLRAGETIVNAGSFLLKTEILKSNIGAGCCEVDPGR
jgi:cobalt-zinc-cadmium efflux system membrane fusion protein